jgi:uncharacterized membrane protein YkoI
MKTFLERASLVIILFSMSVLVTSAERGEMKENPLAQLTRINMIQAQKTALTTAPGKIVESGLEIENGLLVYSFDIRGTSGGITEVQVNAKNGRVVMAKAETEREEAAEAMADQRKVREAGKDTDGKFHDNADNDEERIIGTLPVKKHFRLKKLAKINEIAARKTALQMVEGTVKEVELENEDGFLVYNVSVMYRGEEWEVLVDAGNGVVLKVDPED